MIPSTVGFLDQDFEIETQPSLTYKMDLDGDSVRGLVDEQDAMKQMIFRTLQTERYQYIIYPCIIGFIGKSFQFFVKFFLVFRSPFGEDAFSQVHKPDEVVVE